MIVGPVRWIASGAVRSVVDNEIGRIGRGQADGSALRHEVQTGQRWSRQRLAVMVPSVMVAILVVMFLDLWRGGPLFALDLKVRSWAIAPRSPYRHVLLIPDSVGLRALTAPVLGVVAAGLSWRIRRWRPLMLAALAVFFVNFVVGVIKLSVGRGSSILNNPNLFVGGMLWPSGHAANITMTMAMLLYLLRTYGGFQFGRRTIVAAMTIPTAVLCAASLTLGFHWLSDLMAGIVVGPLVALGVTRFDGARLWGLVD